MTPPAPSGDSSPTSTVQAGSRTVVIDNSPVAGLPIVVLPRSTLGKPGDRCLVLRSSRWWVVPSVAALLLVVTALLGDAWLIPFAKVPKIDWLGFACHTLMLLLLVQFEWGLLTSEARFERGTGLLTLGPLGRRRQRPLAAVLAVQLVHYRVRWGLSRYQLFLVLDDARPTRCLLLQILVTRRNRAWVQGVGRQLADFLGTPLLDQLAAGAAAPP